MSPLGIIVGLALMLGALRWGEHARRRTGSTRGRWWGPRSIAVFLVLLGVGTTVLTTSLR